MYRICIFWSTSSNPFHSTGLFLYPMKTSEKQTFSNAFRGVQKETSDVKWGNGGSLQKLANINEE